MTLTPSLVDLLGSYAGTDDAFATRILDAALSSFEDFGLRKTTVEDVARRAGVARITVYRRFPTKNDLVTAVIVREAKRAFAEIDAAVSGLSSPIERMVEGFAVTLRLGRGHSLLARLMVTEPEVVLPYLTTGGGPLIAAARVYLASHIRQEQASGKVSAFDPEPVAELLVRVGLSFLLTPASAIPLRTDDDARALARDYLVPATVRPATRGRLSGS